MRILSIGNSFSEDAQRWLHLLARQQGLSIQTANLYIGGCTLEQHWANAQSREPAYRLDRNGQCTDHFVSIRQMLLEEWDIITLQQESSRSGLRETYEPYLSSLASLVRELQPQAKLYFHQTWAYEKDFTAERYGIYNFDQETMFRCIRETTHWAAERIGCDLIPTGQVIQLLRRQVPEFRYEDGGLSLCRDGFHLSEDYGRYAASAVWIAKLTGKIPTALPFEDFDRRLLEKILAVVRAYFQ